MALIDLAFAFAFGFALPWLAPHSIWGSRSSTGFAFFCSLGLGLFLDEAGSGEASTEEKGGGSGGGGCGDSGGGDAGQGETQAEITLVNLKEKDE